MSQTISITIPDAIYDALKREGVHLDETPAEVLKGFVYMCYKNPDGAWLNLRPLPVVEVKGQMQLPLDGGAAVAALPAAGQATTSEA